jgi:PEP-CTERM motif
VISSYNNDPSNSSGRLFPDSWTGVHGPTGPGGALAFTSMTGGSEGGGGYTVSLQGAEFVTSTPEPATFLALGGGLVALAVFGRRRYSR